ncbi:MAG: hypothetical protein QOJ91_2417 [Sphingomonadales bacterium]|jgi:hypothetical protein|nr:hypothetical protein [Sphingomonadales bacterium]
MEDSRPRRFTPALALYVIAIVGGLGILAVRIWLIGGLPLWLDETWTAVIAGQRTWTAFRREVWLDPNPPFYYLVMALWPGESNFALRLPSLIFMIAAPLLAFGWRLPGLSRDARLAWAALLFFWAPGLLLSADARSYALLLLVSVGQTIAFARLIERPDLRRATLWCALAGLAVATHYFAAWLALVQGLFYLALRRREAVRTWPALLTLTPLAAWGLYHLPRLLVYARPDVVWYERLSLSQALDVAAYALGPGLLFALLLGAILAACRLLPSEAPRQGARWAAISGVAALALVVAIGMKQPFLVDRYLTPIVPSALLGIVLLARAPAGYALVAAFYLAWINPAEVRGTLQRRAVFGLEGPTRYLLAARPDSLTYSLGYGGARVMDPATTAQIGSYFFERSNQRVKARMIVTGGDALGELLAQARGSRPSIILLYRVENRPDLGRLPADWQCSDQPGYRSGTLACAPKRLFSQRPPTS